MKSISRRAFLAAVPLMGMGLSGAARSQGTALAKGDAALFRNVRIFDGKNPTLSVSCDVLVRRNIIERISRPRRSPLNPA
jgi:hypothetical protein